MLLLVLIYIFVLFSNFSNYRNRFSMPGNTEGLMYSFNLGPIHFISISTEFYYFLNYGIKQLVLQYEWLEADLIEANKPENRYGIHFQFCIICYYNIKFSSNIFYIFRFYFNEKMKKLNESFRIF